MPESVAEFNQAAQMARNGKCAEAIGTLQALVARVPRFYQAFDLMGVCYQQLGRRAQTRQAFLEALKINPRFTDAQVNLGLNSVDQGLPSQAIAEFKRAIELDPASIPALLNLGLVELQINQPEMAARYLERANKLSPHSALVLPALIRTLIAEGKAWEAREYADDAFRVRPVDPDLDFRTGLALLSGHQCSATAQRLLAAAGQSNSFLFSQMLDLSTDSLKMGSYGEALCLLDVARNALNDSAVLHSRLAACYYHLGNPVLAAKQAQQAIRLDPKNEGYYIQLAQIFLDYNTPGAAVQLLEPACRLFSASPRIRFVLGVAYLKSGHLERAEQSLKLSLSMEPDNRQAARDLASVYEQKYDWESLLELARSRLASPVDQYEAYYYQAEATYYLHRQNYLSQSESFLVKSISLNSAFSASHYLLGEALFQQGRYSEAIKSFKKAIALDPAYGKSYYELGKSYQKVGETRKAVEAWQRFRALSQKDAQYPQKELQYQEAK